MIRNRIELERWILITACVTLLAVPSAAARAKVSFLGWADQGDHLFRTVDERGPYARPVSGTVTRTATQVRESNRIERERPEAKSVAVVLPGSSGTVTVTASERKLLAPEAGSARNVARTGIRSVARPLVQPVNRVAGRRELFQLREENRKLRQLVKELSEGPGPSNAPRDAALWTRR